MNFELDTVGWLIVIVGLALALLVAFFIGARVGARRTLRHHREIVLAADTPDPEVNPAHRYRAALIINPTKTDARRLASTAEAICRYEGWAPPLVLETTLADPGGKAATAALDEGVDVVIAAGGDGTVRAVAGALAGTSTPMGIVPLGTGNLLARNVDLVLDKTEWALRIALWGRNRAIDVGRAWIAEDGEAQVFTVMTGLGFDAAVMADTSNELKAKLGWLAYIEAGSRKLVGKPSQVKITFDDDYRVSARVRSVLGGNCGKLQGGIQLLPEAVIDDGQLDVLIVSPKNLGQWVGVVASVIGGRAARGLHTESRKCQKVVIESHEEVDVQLDGDPVGRSSYLAMEVQPLALSVRVPTTEQRKQIRAAAWAV
ncbi:diacylglycerol kinase family lipid kinase [Brevibacterium sp.]|uniref:diacylglycerol/lipid kinase family protein n=1 Tax=Brevibacterium sp. TaxID=1701 RepID=UPI0028111AE0|nr:diacylglycerol kinase family lipid kinase [Brevibacterium sp.]